MNGSLCSEGLLHCLENARTRSVARGTPILASYSQPWSKVDQLRLFSANRLVVQPACLWHRSSLDDHRVGLGQALELIAAPEQPWAALQARWRQLSETAVIEGDHRLALFGGFAFDRHKVRTRLWQDFPDGVLSLSRFELRQDRTGTRLVINVMVDAESDCAGLAEALRVEWAEALARPVAPPLPTRGQYVRQPLAHLWRQDVHNAVRLLKRSALDKVVLARARALQVVEPVHLLLERLQRRQPEAYLFAFSRNDSCFVGATPERLLRVEQRTLHTMALAGTAPRGGDAQQDIRLGAELLASAKDNAEHQMVVASLREHLQRCCSTLEIADRPQLHRLPNVQHLLTPVRGTLKHGVGLLDVLETLHPTPAVGGLPRRAALDYIRRCEQLDRGWYAGPVGWIDDQGDGEFAVALRCALLKDDQATLFAGCGLVSESDPESEFQESAMKMRTMQEVLVPAAQPWRRMNSANKGTVKSM